MRAFSRDCRTISLSVNSRAVCLIRRCSSVRSKSIPLLSGRQLGGAPRRERASLDLLGDALDRQSFLCERVTIAQRERVVLDALVVDRKAQRRTYLVLAAVAPADRAAVIVLGMRARAHRTVDLARELGLPVLAHERQHGRLHGSEPWVQAKDRAHLARACTLALDDFLVVGVDEERERRAVSPGGRLDHVWHVALTAGLVEVLELLAGEQRVLCEVEVAAIGDPLELRPADGEEIFDVARPR